MNTTVIDGLLGKDAEAHTFDNGTKLASFNIAHSDNYKKDNEWIKQTSWVKCKKFSPTDFQLQNLKKGTSVILSGKLKEEKWGKDNKKYSQIVLMVDKISFGRKFEKVDTTGTKEETEGDDLPF